MPSPRRHPSRRFPSFTLVVNASEPFLHLARRAPIPTADVKSSKSPSFHVARVSRCPSPTVPRLDSSSFGRDFRVFIGKAQGYYVRFLPSLGLDSAALHSTFAPLDLDFVFDILRDVPHPHFFRARRRAPHDLSVKFLQFGHPFITYDAVRPIAGSRCSSCPFFLTHFHT